VHHRPVGVVGDPDHGQAVTAQQQLRTWQTIRRAGLVLDAVVLWTMRYVDAAAVDRLRAEGHEIPGEDVVGCPRSSTATSTCWAAAASPPSPQRIPVLPVMCGAG
jgi:hypothetical protein